MNEIKDRNNKLFLSPIVSYLENDLLQKWNHRSYHVKLIFLSNLPNSIFYFFIIRI